jgi:hypothetical protein
MSKKKKYAKKDETIKDIERLIKRDRDFACSAILTLYERQTEDEKESNSTIHKNNVGFNVIDAVELSAIACAISKTKTIDERAYDELKQRLPRYAKQILDATLTGELKEFKRDKTSKLKREFNRIRLTERLRLEQEANAKRDEKKYRERMETVMLQVGKVKIYDHEDGEINCLKIGFKYHGSFVTEIKETRLFKFDWEGKFWYAPLGQEAIDAVLAMEFVPAREKDILRREKDTLLLSVV